MIIHLYVLGMCMKDMLTSMVKASLLSERIPKELEHATPNLYQVSSFTSEELKAMVGSYS